MIIITEKELNALTQTSPALLKRKQHPTLPISIYNYTSTAQYKKFWNPFTLAARGLIIEHETSLVVARPLRKFFNYEENMHKQPKQNLKLNVMEKVDGSLGIWFCYQGQWMMATRQSFTGPQAVEGEKIAKEQRLHEKCDERKTYCFEIIYPENKLVVNYGLRREIVLLAVIDTGSGFDEPNVEVAKIAAALGVKSAKSYNVGDAQIKQLQGMEKLNEEGFVVRFKESGERVKVKFATYLELVKGESNKGSRQVRNSVHTRLLRNPKDKVENHLDDMPDEFYDEARKAQDEFFSMFERAGSEFDLYATQYEIKALKDIPTDLVGQPMLCRWLRLVRSGKGTDEVRKEVRDEYSLRIMRTILKYKAG